MINNLRVLDINDALLDGATPFSTLKNISIEFDEHKNCIYACEKEHCLVQAYLDQKPVILKINLSGAAQEPDLYEKFYLENRLFKEELKVINIRNKEVFADVLMIDDEARELLSFLTPNTENKELISAFIQFLTSLHSERIVIDGLSFDSCFLHDNKVLLSPVKKCKAVYVGDAELERFTAFKHFTVNMLTELLLEIEGIKSADCDSGFKDAHSDLYRVSLEENIKLLYKSGNKYLSNIEQLLSAVNRGEVVSELNKICADESIRPMITGVYSEDRLAAYDKEQGKWGYLNLKGEVKIPFIYDAANSFYEDIAVVKQNGCYGSIDRSGKKLLDFTFRELSWQGASNLYIFKKDSLYGIIDRNGKIIVGETFLHIGEFADGCAVVQSPDNRLFGAINTFGEVVIPPVYNSVEPFSGMRTTATKNGVRVVLDIFGDKI